MTMPGIANSLKSYVSNCRTLNIQPSDLPRKVCDYLSELIDVKQANQNFLDDSQKPSSSLPYVPTWRLLPSEEDIINLPLIKCWTVESPAQEGRTIDFEYYNIPQRTRENYVNAWRRLVIPKEAISEHVKSEVSRLESFGVHIGIHLRFWEDSAARKNSTKARQYLSFFREHKNINAFVATDNTEKVLQSLPLRQRKNCFFYKKNYNLTGLQNDFAELLLLSTFKCLVLTRSSTFSEVAWWLGGANSAIIGLVGKHGDREIGFCNVDESTCIDITAQAGNTWISNRSSLVKNVGKPENLSNAFLTYCREYSWLERRLKHNASGLVDVGANLGLVSLHLAAENHQLEVYAYEPLDDLCCLLEASAALNGISNRYHVINQALGSIVQDMPIFIPDCRADNASLNLVAANLNVKEASVTPKRCRVTTLDTDLFGVRGVQQVDAIKIDVQGHELDVFIGAEKLIKSSAANPNFVIEFEFDPELLKQHGSSPLDIYNQLCSRLSLALIQKSTNQVIEREDLQSWEGSIDILAIPMHCS